MSRRRQGGAESLERGTLASPRTSPALPALSHCRNVSLTGAQTRTRELCGASRNSYRASGTQTTSDARGSESSTALETYCSSGVDSTVRMIAGSHVPFPFR